MQNKMLYGISLLAVLLAIVDANQFYQPFSDGYGLSNSVLSQAAKARVLRKLQQKLALDVSGCGLGKSWRSINPYKCSACGKLTDLRNGFGLGDTCSCGFPLPQASGQPWSFGQQPGEIIQALPPLQGSLASLPLPFDATPKFNVDALSFGGQQLDSSLSGFPLQQSPLQGLPCSGQRGLNFISPDPFGGQLNGRPF